MYRTQRTFERYFGSVIFVILSAAGAALADTVPETWSQVKVADDGALAIVYDAAGGRLGAVSRGEDVLKPMRLGELSSTYPIVNLTQIGGTWVGVASDRLEGRTIVFGFVEDRLDLIDVVDLPSGDAKAADLASDGTLWIADGDRPQLWSIQPCALLHICSLPNRSPPISKIEIYGPSFTELVVDPSSFLAVSTNRFTNLVNLIDIRYGKSLQLEPINDLQGPLGLVLVGGGLGAQATVYISAPESGGVTILQIDPDFQELRPTGSVYLVDLSETSAPLTIGFEPDVPLAAAGGPVAARVAANNDQSLVLIGGLDPNLVHAVARSERTIARIADLRSTEAIVDFDVSADGQTIAILTQSGLSFLDRADLEKPVNALEVRDSSEQERLEADLISAVQRKLTEEGFYLGLVDGLMAPSTDLALKRYASSNALPPVTFEGNVQAQNLPVTLLGHLFQSDLSAVPEPILRSDRGDEIRRAAFDAFYHKNFSAIQNFSSREIFQLGQAVRGEQPCAALNDYPDQTLWPNIGPALAALDELRQKLGTAILVEATYESGAYSDCAGTPKAIAEQAQAYRAIAFSAPKATAAQVMEQVQRRAIVPAFLFDQKGDVYYLSGQPDAGQHTVRRLGKWQALIASHQLNPYGCRQAKLDVDEFRGLLEGTAAQGLPIYVARREREKIYVVTVDAGDDAGLALRVMAAIRAAAPKSADGKTGADSYVRDSDGFSLVADCRREMSIP
ncbi:hypothetical protein [Rhodobacteraceae bacterium DSL-40]|uniref:peptidoglycan-binding domain-containing protein n=1 Tax=Amaricoccus sp. B4 TaxID=3368557 RepID=UPI0013A6EC98